VICGVIEIFLQNLAFVRDIDAGCGCGRTINNFFYFFNWKDFPNLASWDE
jgi:hypothetical protein